MTDRLDGGPGKNKLYGGSGLDWGSGPDRTSMKDVELSLMSIKIRNIFPPSR